MKKNERFWLMHLHKSVFFCIFASYFCARMYSVHDKVRDEIREKIMTNPQNATYNQPVGQMMAPPPMAGGGRLPFGKVQRVWPEWLTKYGIMVYILALAAVSAIYSAYSLPWYYMLSGVVSVLVFFGYGQTLARRLSEVRVRSQKNFEKRIFWIAFILRVAWMLLIYTIFMRTYGDAFGFDNADATGYDEMAREISGAISDGRLIQEWNYLRGFYDFSDMGYASYLGVVYWLSGNSILFSRLLKCLWSSLTVVLMYRLASRNFNQQVARLATVFCALWPNFWYYCGCQLKEVEMVFLAVLFVEQTDQMLRSRQFTAWKLMPILLIDAALFTIRTPLALVAILALLFTMLMSSTKVVSWGKRIIVGLIAVLLIGVTMGNRIQEESRHLVETVRGGYQKGNMQWRSERKDASGNQQKFAQYVGAAVFAPMIFTLPFPTMIRYYDGQNVQQLLNGGNFVKNILSAFVILSLVVLLMSGKWRQHLLPLVFMLGYVVILTMSAFAQSERFHQPVM
ncbi:MAG: glycosyltransferase family 39 protein, partial [Paludibacteraceae bacterium]|nr:glycosyltransferase family 39 protein [Paludibacteraceae bacterium]